MSINLNDILNFSDLRKVKVRFNQSNGSYDPLRFFKEDKKSLLNGQFWNYNKEIFQKRRYNCWLYKVKKPQMVTF